MKKIILSSITLLTITSLLLFAGCSKGKGTEKLIGKWRVDITEENMEAIYEFSKTTMVIKLTAPETPPQTITIPYKVISDNDKTLLLEIIHPATQQKGIFTLTFDSDDNNGEYKRAALIDPEGFPIKLIRI